MPGPDKEMAQEDMGFSNLKEVEIDLRDLTEELGIDIGEELCSH